VKIETPFETDDEMPPVWGMSEFFAVQPLSIWQTVIVEEVVQFQSNLVRMWTVE
jgi:hypothetical protein